MIDDILTGNRRIPVFVLTGFLGSGKTSLLSRLLAAGRLSDTAVLVNEFGELGIDQLLIRQIDERVVLLNAGCVCCSIREDLLDALRELFVARLRGETGAFQRVLIETSGISDPVPILHTLLSDPFLMDRFCVGGVVTLVDGGLAMEDLTKYPEALHQLVAADLFIMTKTDLSETSQMQALQAELAAMNPQVPCVSNLDADMDRIQAFLDSGADGQPDVGLGPRRIESGRPSLFDGGKMRLHVASAYACVLRASVPLSWDALMAWIEQLLSGVPQRVLRLKGFVDIEGQELPIVIQSVRHIFHPASSLPEWPDAERSTRLVLILENLERQSPERLLAQHLPQSGPLSDRLLPEGFAEVGPMAAI